MYRWQLGDFRVSQNNTNLAFLYYWGFFKSYKNKRNSSLFKECAKKDVSRIGHRDLDILWIGVHFCRIYFSLWLHTQFAIFNEYLQFFDYFFQASQHSGSGPSTPLPLPTTLSSLLPLSGTSVSASATSTSSPLTSLASSSGVPISGAPPTPTSGTNGNGQGVDLSQQAAAMANVSVSTYLNHLQVILYQINIFWNSQKIPSNLKFMVWISVNSVNFCKSL